MMEASGKLSSSLSVRKRAQKPHLMLTVSDLDKQQPTNLKTKAFPTLQPASCLIHPRLRCIEQMAKRTVLAFHHNGKLLRHSTRVLSVLPFSALEQDNQGLFKQVNNDEDHVVVTEATIFHPQGGGQPSDEGFMEDKQHNIRFQVKAVRTDVVNDGQVLHVGRFLSQPHQFNPLDKIEQVVDEEKRLLYSRLHTAGHVLGAAVRHLLENKIDGFDELKASHFPESAACEFRGAIEGKWKPEIQAKVDEYVKRAMPVEIDFWTEQDFCDQGLQRLVPDKSFLAPGEDKFRVVKIVGAEVYPCGGTHVDTTDLCGETTVKKIARSKGISRVSYTVAQ